MSDREQFESQLTGIDSHPILDKIYSKGYWRVSIRPVAFNLKRIKAITELRAILESCVVSFTQRHYPHFLGANDTIGQDFIQGVTDCRDHLEFYRFWQSGQFVHYMALREDYYALERRWLRPNMALHTLTEIYVFAECLTRRGILVPGVEIRAALHKLDGRTLYGPLIAG